jgi:prolipoprotein diacylglyceryltransferase
MVRMAPGALVGSRAFYLAEHGGLSEPGAWVGSRGFTFYGGFILVALALAAYVWRAPALVEPNPSLGRRADWKGCPGAAV